MSYETKMLLDNLGGYISELRGQIEVGNLFLKFRILPQQTGRMCGQVVITAYAGTGEGEGVDGHLLAALPRLRCSNIRSVGRLT